jgi:hypothetical protein
MQCYESQLSVSSYNSENEHSFSLPLNKNNHIEFLRVLSIVNCHTRNVMIHISSAQGAMESILVNGSSLTLRKYVMEKLPNCVSHN